MYTKDEIKALEKEWNTNPRWKGIKRPYSAEEVVKLRGTLQIDYPLARRGAEKLWQMLSKEPFIRALGAVTGNQAVQQVQAGLKSIYVSGWQVAADMNDVNETYPDMGLYPFPSVPHLVKRINNALTRADQIEHLANSTHTDWFVPIIADAEAGFGGPLNVFEVTKALVQAGAAAFHLEDQLSSLKKCGHMGGKVLEPVKLFTEKLIAARLATDVLSIPTLLIARTDAESASLIRSDFDLTDHPHATGERSPEGYYYIKGGIEYAIERAIEFAPFADIVWCETAKPDLQQAKVFAEGVHKKFPGKWLAYNCSPSFNWKSHLSATELLHFQEELSAMGYKFQFVTLAGFHTINASMFELANDYAKRGMAAYGAFQEHEFSLEKSFGYQGIKHQSFVGTGYFDQVQVTIHQRETATTGLSGSTEEKQF